MKKIFRTAFIAGIIFATMLLTSCFDYVQSISYKNGQYEIYYKLTFSKIIMALAGEEATEDDLIGEFAEGGPFDKSEITEVDTDIEKGFEARISIDPKTKDADEKSLLPKKSGNKCYIPFTFAKDFSSDELGLDDDESGMAYVMLSSVKCRVLVSKKIIQFVSRAYFEGTDGAYCSVPFYDYGDSFCIEVPLPLIMTSPSYRLDRIVLETAGEI